MQLYDITRRCNASGFADGNVKEAARAVASYLRFFPAHADMGENKLFYLGLEHSELTWFKVRAEAEAYVRRNDYEGKLLEFIEESFQFDEFEPMREAEEKVEEEVDLSGRKQRGKEEKGEEETSSVIISEPVPPTVAKIEL
jgi:hypothetical protein